MTPCTQARAVPHHAAIHNALLDRLLAEAASLAEEARDAVEITAATRRRSLQGLRTQQELGVIATGLAHCVGWLLEQKAIAAGELTHATPPPLEAELGRPRPDPLAIDPYVADLGERVRAFVVRIDRLATA